MAPVYRVLIGQLETFLVFRALLGIGFSFLGSLRNGLGHVLTAAVRGKSYTIYDGPPMGTRYIGDALWRPGFSNTRISHSIAWRK